MANIFKRVANFLVGEEPTKVQKNLPATQKRLFEAASISRLTSDMIFSPQSGDAEVRYALRTLRARSREAVSNDSYSKKFISMLSQNVVGRGVRMRSKAGMEGGKDPDKVAREAIEDAWEEWGKKENCTVTGRLSWPEVQRQVIQTVARDGECLIRLVRGFPNDFGFSLQLIESDNLWEDYNQDLGANRRIKMGVEVNEWGRPVAYHLLGGKNFQVHPYDWPFGSFTTFLSGSTPTQRVPADEIIHLFIQDRSSRCRGYPWITNVLMGLHMLSEYEGAELVAARVGANKLGFIFSQRGNEYEGDEVTPQNQKLEDMEPGSIQELSNTMKFEKFDPDHPNAGFGAFVKSILRSTASGLNVSYAALANDLESTSYAAARIGWLEERDGWITLTDWFVNGLHPGVYNPWLECALLKGKALRLPAQNIQAYRNVEWIPRGFAYLDPDKEATANLIALNSGLTSRSRIAAQQGLDYEEILADLQAEKALEKSYGVSFVQTPTGNPKSVISISGGPSEPGDNRSFLENVRILEEKIKNLELTGNGEDKEKIEDLRAIASDLVTLYALTNSPRMGVQ